MKTLNRWFKWEDPGAPGRFVDHPSPAAWRVGRLRLLAEQPADSNVLTQDLSEPLGGVTTAKFDINTGTGNLTIDRLTGGEPLLAGGTLEYLENQGLPTRSLTTINGQATLTLRGERHPTDRVPFPLGSLQRRNRVADPPQPQVSYDITAHSDGGNVKLNLAGMAVTRVSADTGGGNMDVILPDNTANLNVTAKTGAGNVTVEIGSGITGSNTINASSGAGNVVVRLPDGIAARIHATSGMGKAIVDPRFSKIDDNTYQSPDYDSAADKVEITVNSGAGNVSVNTK